MPPDLAMASDVRLVDNKIVIAGGVITANRPHFDMKSRRFCFELSGSWDSGSSFMFAVPYTTTLRSILSVASISTKRAFPARPNPSFIACPFSGGLDMAPRR